MDSQEECGEAFQENQLPCITTCAKTIRDSLACACTCTYMQHVTIQHATCDNITQSVE